MLQQNLSHGCWQWNSHWFAWICISRQKDTNFFKIAVVSDETWVYVYDPKTRQQSSQCKMSSYLCNPRKCTKFDARQRWCLSLFWTMPNCKAAFLFTSTKRSLWCSSPLANQGNCTVITNSSWQHTCTLGPNCSSFYASITFHRYVKPILPRHDALWLFLFPPN